MVSPLMPLAWNVPIVDEKGNPTPYFQRMLQQLLQEKDQLQEDVDLTAAIDIIAGTGLDGGGPLDGSSDVTLDLADTTVTPGSYTNTNLTVDQQGRITLATNGSTGGGGAWALAGAGQTATGIYNQAVDGTKATVDFTSLGSYTDIMVICSNITKSVSGGLGLRLSVNNGVSYYSASGDYSDISTAGVLTNATALLGFHNTAATAARSGMAFVYLAGVNNSPKRGQSLIPSSGCFNASSLPVDAIRVYPASGGDITGGTVHCYVR